MGMPDAVTKMYIRENDVFADVVNYFLYGGEPVVLPDHLTELDPVELMLLPGRKGKKETVETGCAEVSGCFKTGSD